MQLFFLPRPLMILLFFVLWFCYQAGAAWLCFRLPVEAFRADHWLYRARAWERHGALYQDLFRVRAWKGLLPDGGALFAKGYAKKRLADFSPENLTLFLAESRRAELTHWLAMLPFWTFGLFAPFFVVPVMLVYALAANLPCIIAQRYNRPRIEQLLEKSLRRHQAGSEK